MPHGFEYSLAEVGSASSTVRGPIKVDLKNSYGQFANLHLNNHGPIRTDENRPVQITATEALLRRDRAIVIGGLAVVVALAWFYVLTGAGTGMSVWAMTRIALSPGAFGGAGMASPFGWTILYWTIMFLMWWVMMIAMMVPSATPVVLLYARVTRHAQKGVEASSSIVPTAAFAGGYLIAWLGFSLVAVALQFGFEQASLTSPMLMWSLNPWLSAGLLLAAGGLSTHGVETNLSRALSNPIAISLEPLATWSPRCAADGDPAWGVLRGLLLGVDGASICRRDNEFALDSGAGDLRSRREGFAGWSTPGSRWRRRLHRRCGVDWRSRDSYT